jgi:hypothetical protein
MTGMICQCRVPVPLSLSVTILPVTFEFTGTGKFQSTWCAHWHESEDPHAEPAFVCQWGICNYRATTSRLSSHGSSGVGSVSRFLGKGTIISLSEPFGGVGLPVMMMLRGSVPRFLNE